MSSVRYIAPYGDEPGKCYVQETTNEFGSTAYVLTEHPDNEGRHVSAKAYDLGDSLIGMKQESDPSFRPESLRIFAERPERGQDGESRFSELQAQTTLYENVSMVPNVNEPQATGWRWDDGNRMDKPDMEQRVGAEVETAIYPWRDRSVEDLNKEFDGASLSPIPKDSPQLQIEHRPQEGEREAPPPQEATTVQEREQEIHHER